MPSFLCSTRSRSRLRWKYNGGGGAFLNHLTSWTLQVGRSTPSWCWQSHREQLSQWLCLFRNDLTSWSSKLDFQAERSTPSLDFCVGNLSVNNGGDGFASKSPTSSIVQINSVIETLAQTISAIQKHFVGRIPCRELARCHPKQASPSPPPPNHSQQLNPTAFGN
jgi:hypothetical protein